MEQEKENIKQIIDGKIDNKARYSLDRCIEEMYKDQPYGLYKYGYVEDLEKITPQDLYKYYKKMISECKIDIFISGEIDENIEKDEWLEQYFPKQMEVYHNAIEQTKEQILNQLNL